jgi:hypothetical protein
MDKLHFDRYRQRWAGIIRNWMEMGDWTSGLVRKEPPREGNWHYIFMYILLHDIMLGGLKH